MQQKNSRFGALLVAVVLVVGALGVVVAQNSGDSSRTRNAAVEAGLACKRLGQTKKVGSKRFTCGNSQGAKLWILTTTSKSTLATCTSLGALKTQKGATFVCATVGKKKLWLPVVLKVASAPVKESNANAASGSSSTVPADQPSGGAANVVNVDVSKAEAPVATPIGIRMATQPSGAVNGAPFTQAAVVQLRDEEGKDVALAGVRVEAILLGAQLNFIETTLQNVEAITDSQGRATFTKLSITGQIGTYELLFIPSGLGAVISDFVELAPGAPVALEMAVQPWGARSGDVLMLQPLVEARDISGNVALGAAGKVVTVEAVGAGRLSNAISASSVAADTDGTAQFSGLSISGTAGAYQLKFSSPGLKSVTSRSFAISSGDAAEVRVVTAASGAVSGKAFTQQPVIETYDADGNLIREAGWVINASITSGVATLANTSATTNDAGRATFTELTASGKIGDFAIAYSVKNGRDIVAAVDSEAISLTEGEATKLIMVQQPVDMPSGGTMSVSPEVQIADSWGNPTTSAVSVRATLNGTKLSREPWSRDFTPDQSGKVRLSTPSYFGKAQNLQLSFSAGETLTGVVSNEFALTPGTPTRLDVETVSAMPSGSFIAKSKSEHRLTARLYDSAQNVVDNVPYPLHATVTQSDGAWINGYPHAESDDGYVVFPAVKIYGVTGGTVTVVLSVGNLFDADPVTLSVSSDATVGDPGPSTGTIFFDKKTATAASVSLTAQQFADLPFRYLEESPLSAETALTFATEKTNNSPSVTEKLFGSGNANTVKLMAVDVGVGTYLATRYADALSVNSTNGSFNDWYLPSADELKSQMVNLREDKYGKSYWSSSVQVEGSLEFARLGRVLSTAYNELWAAVDIRARARPIRAMSFAPSKPTNVTASVVSTSAATLRFTQVPSPLSGDIRYEVTPSPAASITTVRNSDGSLAISGLASATSYTFSVTAIGAYGRSEVSQSTAAVITTPLPPNTVSAYGFGDGFMGIYCNSPSAGAGVNPTVEIVSGLSGLTIERTSSCSFRVSGVLTAAVYNIALVSRIGTVESEPVSVRFTSAPQAPSNLRGAADRNGTLTFTFIAPPSNGPDIFYDVRQSGPTFIGSFSSTGQTFTIRNLQKGGTYRFALRAYVLAEPLSMMVASQYSPDLVVTVP